MERLKPTASTTDLEAERVDLDRRNVSRLLLGGAAVTPVLLANSAVLGQSSSGDELFVNQASYRSTSGIGDIGVYASNPHGSVNTWWIETGNGLVVIDGQRQTHEAKLAVEAIKSTGRPVIAILVTHEHSDHVGGLPVFRQAFGDDVPMYASATTIENLRTDPVGDFVYSKQFLGPSFPTFPHELEIPNMIFADGDTLRFGELTFEIAVQGVGEGSSGALFHIPELNALVIGDLASNGFTPYFGRGHTAEWLDNIAEVRGAFPDTIRVYPGHGDSGPITILDVEADYIRYCRDLVSNHGDGQSPLDPIAIQDLVDTIWQRFPADYNGRPPVASITDAVRVNVNALAIELGRAPEQT